MTFSSLTTVAVSIAATTSILSRPVSAGYETFTPMAGRLVWEDWLYVRELISTWIDLSSCPSEGTDALRKHWDYDCPPEGETGHDTCDLSGDCILFKRQRNPNSLGSRLVRHAFHDAVGGFDGWVNVHDKKENGGLNSTQFVLEMLYENDLMPDDTPLKNVLSMADFSAWAMHAALLDSAQRQVGNKQYTAPDSDDPSVPYDHIPQIPVRYGRNSYIKDNDTDSGPTETFPPHGGSSTGQQIAEYFDEYFNYTPRQTVTLMGVHTFGGARRAESGYTGMWTQSKNVFNNEYQSQMLFPIPLHCDAATASGIDDCTFISHGGSDRNGDLTSCTEGNEGRCEGWEQVMIRNGQNSIFGPKFQWRHSCRANGTDCTHIMMNVDLGLYRNLEGFICTKEDEEFEVDAVQGQKCKEGMVKSYPLGSPGGCLKNDTNQRILATCFHLNDMVADASGKTMSGAIEEDADKMTEWIDSFAPLFDDILTYNLTGGLKKEDLQVLTAPASPAPTPAPTLANRNDPCPCPYPFSTISEETYGCEACRTNFCQWILRPNKGVNETRCVGNHRYLRVHGGS